MSEVIFAGINLESFADAFIGSIDFEWDYKDYHGHDGPLVAAADIQVLNRSLDDMTPVLEGSREVVIGDIEARFREERGPDGAEWQEWAESYAPVAARKNIGKLRRKGSEQLYEAVTDRSAYPIVENDMFIDTSGFPEYWAIQQYGGVIGSQSHREVRKVRRAYEKRHGLEPTNTSGEIPPRPYLGMSDQASFMILDQFDMWLTGEIIGWSENPLRGPGAMQPRMKSGQFGKMRRI